MNYKNRDRFSYSVITGRIDTDGMRKNDINLLINTGFMCAIRVKDEVKYYANPYILINIKPNDTLCGIFNYATYCSNGDICNKHSSYFSMHKDCNNCLYRIPCTMDELLNPKFKNTEDNFEIGDPPETNITYREYLKSEYWKEFKKEALKHYEGKCNWCGASQKDANLHVHHIKYGEWFNEKLENVILLCKDCHKRAHGKVK